MMRWLALLLLMACSAAQAGFTLLPGSSPQTTKYGTAFPNPIQLRVTDDATGQPVVGKSIDLSFSPELYPAETVNCSFVVHSPGGGGGDGVFCHAVTDSNGVASFAMLAYGVGKGSLTFKIPGSPTAELNVIPRTTPVSVAVIAGASQTRMLNVPFDPVQFKLTRDGVPVSGLRVSMALDKSASFSFTGQGSWGSDDKGMVTSPTFTMQGGPGTTALHLTAFDAESGVRIDEQVKLYSLATEHAPYAPLWWGGLAQGGWGVALPQHATSIFPVLFTYDGQGNPTWFILAGNWTQGFAGTYDARLQSFKGAPYYAFDASRVTGALGASAALQFTSDTAFTLKVPILQEVTTLPTRSIAMQPFDIAGGQSTAEPSSYPADVDLNDMWWGGASQSGWGLAIARKGSALFLTWFTYDANGNPTWFVMPADGRQLDPMSWTGPIYRTSGKSILGLAPYEPSAYVAAKVGDFTIRFDGMTRGTFDFTVEGHTGSLAIQRFDF